VSREPRLKEGLGMNIRSFSASSAPAGFHAQVCEVSGATRLAFVSGQVPATAKGDVPETFDEQSRLIWTNIEAQLAEVGMTLDNVVKVTTFLSDRKYGMANRAIRSEVLGARTPAVSVIICGLFDETWLMEIEVVAAA
jgi:2-iminobutanoate/2-iminopropanoate deaminase